MSVNIYKNGKLNKIAGNANGGGGSSGTSDYKNLINKPRINNIELNGNKTSSDLGIENYNKLNTKEEVKLTNVLGNVVDAKVVKDMFGGMTFGVDSKGNYGYIKDGADTVTPFKTGGNIHIDITSIYNWDQSFSEVLALVYFNGRFLGEIRFQHHYSSDGGASRDFYV